MKNIDRTYVLVYNLVMLFPEPKHNDQQKEQDALRKKVTDE
jgi:hypothetical protein